MSTVISRAGLTIREHFLDVPLCHAAQGAGHGTDPLWCGCTPGDERTLRLFVREVVQTDADSADRPALTYFQGGPGFGADRVELVGGWLERALEDYRVFLIDQRGTGLSTPVSDATVPGSTVTERANYLTHFRADSIVRDAELVRHALFGGRTWTAMGQSFGGFCCLSYLSLAPGGLDAAIITAGLPSIDGDADAVYRATFAQTSARNAEFFATFPQDAERTRIVADHLDRIAEHLPSGERLTRERFLSLGLMLGSDAGFPRLHSVLESAVPEPDRVGADFRLSPAFLVAADAALSFAANPIYAVLHEPIYAQGAGTRWAAARVRADLPEFGPDSTLFTGEMIFPAIFDTDPALECLREVADELATRDGWPALYDADVLAENTVPVAAAIYTDDMFVPAAISLATAARVRGLRPLITNDYQHDGLRQDGRYLFDRLRDKTRGL